MHKEFLKSLPFNLLKSVNRFLNFEYLLINKKDIREKFYIFK